MSIAFSTSARAEVPVLIGDKESYTANTGFARVANSAAAFYNPAGLARATTPKLSVSATAYQSLEQKISGELNAGVKSFQSIPTQVTSTWRIGSSTIALSAFNTINYDFALPLTLNTESLGSIPARITVKESRLMVGPTFSRRISERVDAGVSILVEKRDAYSNAVMNARFIDAGSGASVHVMQQTEDKESSLVAVPTLGINYHHSEALIVGLKVVPISVQISGTLQSFRQSMVYVDTGAGIVESPAADWDVEEELKRKVPPQIGLGINRLLSPRWRLLVDIHQSFKTSNDAYETNGVKITNGETQPTYTGAFGGSIGTEYYFNNKYLSLGALISENAERAESANANHFYGFSGGWTNIHDLFESSVGGYYLSGEKGGDNSARAFAFGLLLSTSYRF